MCGGNIFFFFDVATYIINWINIPFTIVDSLTWDGKEAAAADRTVHPRWHADAGHPDRIVYLTCPDDRTSASGRP